MDRPPAPPGSAVRIEGVPFEPQPRGPGCIAACAAMILRFHGIEAGAVELMRSVPVWPDGISLFDIEEEARKRGAATLAFTAGGETLRTLVTAGYPVMAIVDRGTAARSRHAVVVIGHGDAPAVVERLDPAAPGVRVEPAPAFLERFGRAGGAVLLVYPMSGEARLEGVAGFDLARARRENARFRGIELASRAEAHADHPSAQKVALYRRAVAEAPSLPALHNNLAVALAGIGDADEAREHLGTALRIDPSFALARENLERLARRADLTAGELTDTRAALPPE